MNIQDHGSVLVVKIAGGYYLGNSGEPATLRDARTFANNKRRFARQAGKAAKVRVQSNGKTSIIVCGSGSGIRYWNGTTWVKDRNSALEWSCPKFARRTCDGLR